MEEIFREPDRAKVPDTPSGRYAVATAVARHMKRENVSAAFRYAKRLPKEFEVLCIVDAVKRDSMLCSTNEFTVWSVANTDVML